MILCLSSDKKLKKILEKDRRKGETEREYGDRSYGVSEKLGESGKKKKRRVKRVPVKHF